MKANEWISVSERLPEAPERNPGEKESDYVEIKLSTGEVMDGWWNSKYGWDSFLTEEDNLDVIEWRHLPSKP